MTEHNLFYYRYALDIVTPATVLAKYEEPIAAAMRRDMADREFLDLCDAQSQASGRQRCTLSLAKLPRDLQADQTMRHLLSNLVHEVASHSCQHREQVECSRKSWEAAPTARFTHLARRLHDGR